MTISSRQPLLYFLLLILLLQWSGKKSYAAVIYLRGNNYVDPFYHDLNYYDALANLEYDTDPSESEGKLTQQAQIDDAQVEAGEQEDTKVSQQLEGVRDSDMMDHGESDGENEHAEDGASSIEDDSATSNRKRDTSENSQHAEQEQKASYTCHAQTPEQQACLDAAVKDTKDTIDHVTTLIRRMREHAISIVKEINELEGDFLGACQDNPPPNCPRKPPKSKCKAPYGIGGGAGDYGGGYIDGASGFKRIYNDPENNNNNNNNNNYNENNNDNNNDYNNNNQNRAPYYPNANDNRNSNENSESANGNSNNNGNDVGSSNPNVNTNTNSNPNAKGAPTKPRILINEFAMPLRADQSDLSPREFFEQAQYAVHAWKNQIEDCKRILDEALYHASQQQQQQQQPTALSGADNPSTSVQHIVKMIKAPEETDSLRSDYAAPSAAASITPVRSVNMKENTNNLNYPNVIDNTSDGGSSSSSSSSTSSISNKNTNNINSDYTAALAKAKSNEIASLKGNDKVTDDKSATSAADGSKAVHGDNNNDADTDINDSTNNKRNEDSKKCRSEKATKKKNRAIAPLLSVLQGMGF